MPRTTNPKKKSKPRQKKIPLPKQNNSSNQPKKFDKVKLINIMLIMLVFTLSITLFTYLYLNKHNDEKLTNDTITYDDNNKEYKNNYNEEEYRKELEEIRKQRQEKYNDSSKRFEEINDEFYKDYSPNDDVQKDINETKENEKVVLDTNKNDENTTIQKPKEIAKPKPKETKENEKVVEKNLPKLPPKITHFSGTPKLAIIIDDVTTQSEVNQIKSIGYTVNMSIMPPTKGHKNSAEIAKNLNFYMIHFPMQANSFKFEETNTLHIGDSYEKIEQRVAQIRQWYPNAIYTNNHTGSMFTSDRKSMDYLFQALKKYNFIFVDSRTTAKSVAQEMAKKYDMPYIARNVFLDNEQKYGYVQNQLKQAIQMAKQKGYAIAIGHPHDVTIKVLRDSKHLLEGLELVYIDKIPTR